MERVSGIIFCCFSVTMSEGESAAERKERVCSVACDTFQGHRCAPAHSARREGVCVVWRVTHSKVTAVLRACVCRIDDFMHIN